MTTNDGFIVCGKYTAIPKSLYKSILEEVKINIQGVHTLISPIFNDNI